MNEERRQISFFASYELARNIESTAEKYGMKRGEFIKWVLKSFIASQNAVSSMNEKKPNYSEVLSDFNDDKAFAQPEECP